MDFGSVGAMDKTSDQAIFSAILASHILDPYLEQNPQLAELIKTPDHPDIHYFGKPAPAREIAPPLKRRLAMMAARNISHNLAATKELVGFMEEHPDSEIYDVTFNCPTQHYGVRFAWVDDRVHVICVMTGGHIPDDLLGASTL